MCIWWSTRLAVLLGRSENRESVNRSVGMPIPQSAKISSINSWVLLSGYCVLLFLFSHPVMSDSETPSPGICPSSCSLHQWCRLAVFSNALFSYCPQSFPASGTFPVGYLFASDDQNTGASASASVKIPVNIQWTVLFNRRKQQKGKTRDLFRKIGNIKGAFCPRCAE